MSRDQAIVRLGTIASLGVLAYALGKLFLGGLGDFWGGRVSFLIGLGGATVFTLLFASAGEVPIFTIAWFGNRLTQSIAWAGLIKVSSKWFDYSSYGTIIGILSISYLVGDAAARQSMGALIERGFGWQVLFCFAAGVAGLILVANLVFLRESRTAAGFPEAKPNPLNLFAEAESPPSSVARPAVSAAAQPRFPHRLRAFARLHDNPRDLQHLDSPLPQGLLGLLDQQSGRYERGISRRRRRIGARERLA